MFKKSAPTFYCKIQLMDSQDIFVDNIQKNKHNSVYYDIFLTFKEKCDWKWKSFAIVGKYSLTNEYV